MIEAALVIVRQIGNGYALTGWGVFFFLLLLLALGNRSD